MDDLPPAQSAKPAKAPIRACDLVGFKSFQSILPLLDRLHDDACARDKAHNRSLHYDQYAALQLLFFFNPIITSMRGLVEAGKLDKVRKKLGVSPTSLGSFSEAAGVFDLDLLQGIVAELGAKLTPLKHDTRLDEVPGVIQSTGGTDPSKGSFC